MFLRVLLSSLLLVCVVGCGESGPAKKATFSASGKLLVDDKPFGPATLTFSAPTEDAQTPSMTGNVAQDGTISFVTYGQDGVVAEGTYNVTMAADIMSASTVPATQPATVDVKSGTSSIEVKLTSIPGAAPIGNLPMPVLTP